MKEVWNWRYQADSVSALTLILLINGSTRQGTVGHDINININNIVTEINVKEKAKHNIASNNKRIPIIKIIY